MKINSLYGSTDAGDSLSLFCFGWLFILTVLSGDGQIWLLLDSYIDIQVQLNTHLGMETKSSICPGTITILMLEMLIFQRRDLSKRVQRRLHHRFKKNSRVKSIYYQLCKLAECNNSLGWRPFVLLCWATTLPATSSAMSYWETRGSSQLVHTSLLALIKSSLVWRLLNVLVNISSSDQLFGPVPHRQPCSWVIEEHPVITCPHYTPDTGQQNKGTFKTTNRMTGRALSRGAAGSPWRARYWICSNGPSFLSCLLLLCHLFFFWFLVGGAKVYFSVSI